MNGDLHLALEDFNLFKWDVMWWFEPGCHKQTVAFSFRIWVVFFFSHAKLINSILIAITTLLLVTFHHNKIKPQEKNRTLLLILLYIFTVYLQWKNK